ncbi:DNA-3-methyladenine glycosylase I [Buchananella hordeovulneris]|uniref:DNA-3-methyladenine glycosylase I n=1 Tax=Buchananella hordeovulneris TaxID=52770 RepID=UPI000F5F5325|nr:DNA-3-methyladenine glycosylase I [Buchananella hordeovulneris]RRD52502.1 DNA-3-methyladenine glycosylase I [Buchananella hordeovulneris]
MSTTDPPAWDARVRPAWAATDPLLRRYYDEEWGQCQVTEAAIFERLCLEVFQAGLAWRTVLGKRPALRDAFADFAPDAVAAFTAADVERLLTDPRLIRNRAKIAATVTNARATVELRRGGGLARLVWDQQPAVTPVPLHPADVPSASPQSRALTGALRERGFVRVGPVTLFALMEAIGVVDTNLVGTWKRGITGLWDVRGRRRCRPPGLL